MDISNYKEIIQFLSSNLLISVVLIFLLIVFLPLKNLKLSISDFSFVKRKPISAELKKIFDDESDFLLAKKKIFWVSTKRELQDVLDYIEKYNLSYFNFKKAGKYIKLNPVRVVKPKAYKNNFYYISLITLTFTYGIALLLSVWLSRVSVISALCWQVAFTSLYMCFLCIILPKWNQVLAAEGIIDEIDRIDVLNANKESS